MTLGPRGMVFGVCIAALVPLAVGTFLIFSPEKKISQSAALANIRACANTANAVLCARAPVQKLLNTVDGAEVMQLIARNLPPTQCHSVGHVVGQQVYRRNKNVERALGECSDACFSACTHGVIGEAFVEEAGLDDPTIDTEHLSVDEIKNIGKKLCATYGACHGVGHALFLQSGDIDTSAGVCHDIATNRLRESCYAGVYMEYQQELTSTSAWTSTSTLAKLTPPSLPDFCKKTSQSESSACFAYFTPIAIDTFIRAGEATSTIPAYPLVRKVCTSYLDKDLRSFCIFGYGAYRYQLALTDPAGAAFICKRFTQTADQLACVSGVVSRAGQYDKLETVFAYCEAISEQSVSAKCYADALALYVANGGSIDDAKKLCTSGSLLCLQQAQKQATTSSNIENPQSE